MTDTKSEARCSNAQCSGIILADTEDWIDPLCHACWQALGKPVAEPNVFEYVEISAYTDLLAKHERVLQMLEATRQELLSLTFRGNCPRCDQAEISIQHVLAQTAGLK